VAATMSGLRHFRAILLLPFLVTVMVPATILLFTGPDTLGLGQSVPASRVALPILGGLLLCLGLVLLVATITNDLAVRPWLIRRSQSLMPHSRPASPSA